MGFVNKEEFEEFKRQALARQSSGHQSEPIDVIIKQVAAVDDSTEAGKWIKSMVAQCQDIICRADITICEVRHQHDKIREYWKTYLTNTVS